MFVQFCWSSKVDALVQQTVATFGSLHHCFNNAGIEGGRAPLHETAPGDFERVMAVNAGGVFNCMRAEIRQMLAQLKLNPVVVGASPKSPKAVDTVGLSIVNTSSTAGLSAMAEFSPYCASKHAVIGLTRCAAREYAPFGIRVNCVCPSTTDTPMVQRFSQSWPDWQDRQNSSFPAGRIGTPEEVAEAVLWLSSPRCPMVCGSCLTIDGALTA
ncbi:unnamed protein product [Prorocentrum cordatum]|uniref:Uncharacterized protein n=1 Tax=Prorocentrum cordatum TaxID=2364126 RepID=A0ABN9SQB4_9DINO|nr:unnamed protein product [Polarella glacialis]